MSVELPEGWTEAILGEGLAIDVQPGFACGSHNRAAQGVPHLRPMNISKEGRIDLGNLKFVSKKEVHCDERLLRCRDVLFNNTNSPELVGKTACYDLPEPRAFSNHMTRLRCHPKVLDSNYCALALHTKWMDGYFESICNNHVSQASISRTVLLKTPIRLPPLTEQQRIVAKVEALLASVNAIRHRLAKAPPIVKRFRQSVLAAACSGRITGDWRQRNSNSEVTSRKSNSGSDPDGLPSTWFNKPLEELCDPRRAISYGVLKPGEYVEGGIPLLRIVDIVEGIATAENAHRISQQLSDQYRRTLLRGDEVVVSLVGTIGRIGYVPANLSGANLHRNLGLVAPGVTIASRYLFHAMCSPSIQAQIEDVTSGANQALLNLADLRQLTIPLPPVAEQEEIVRRVEALFGPADAIEDRVAAATARAEKLTQAILAKAFRGELVPTEADLARRERRDYEPASALLERIRAERTQRDGDSKPRRGIGKSAGPSRRKGRAP
jgi:type I restriction enzyme, S subunit